MSSCSGSCLKWLSRISRLESEYDIQTFTSIWNTVLVWLDRAEIVIMQQMADVGSNGPFMCSIQLATVAVVQYVSETAMQCVLVHPLGAGLIICQGWGEHLKWRDEIGHSFVLRGFTVCALQVTVFMVIMLRMMEWQRHGEIRCA